MADQNQDQDQDQDQKPKTPPSKQPSGPGQGIKPGEVKNINVPGADDAPGRTNVTETTTTTTVGTPTTTKD